MHELEALYGSEVVGIAIFDARMTCVRVNAAFQRLARNIVTQPVGASFADMARALPEQVEVMRTVIAGGQPALGRLIEGPLISTLADYLPTRDAAGAVTGCMMVVHEITAQRQAERELAQRLAMAEMISEISATFIDLPSSEINSGLANALGTVGEGLGLDRTHVGLFSSDQQRVSLTHQWVRPGTQATIEDFQDFQVKFLPWLAKQMLTGEVVVLHSADDLPADAEAERLLFQAMGHRSMVMVPLTVGKEIIGLVEFVATNVARRWTGDVIAGLQLVVEIFASAIDRKRADDALRDRLRATELILHISAGFIDLPPDQIDAGIDGALKAIGETLALDRAQVALLDDQRKLVKVMFQWTGAEMPRDPVDFGGMPLSQFPWIAKHLASGEPIVLNDLSELPPEAVLERQMFEFRGNQALVMMPITVGRRVIGLVGFGMLQRKRLWTVYELTTLQLMVQIIGNALARKHADEERRRAFEELGALKGRIERERDYLREEIRIERGFEDIVGGSAALTRALDGVNAVARTTATVLVRGESGVGKELFAREIHARSARSEGPLVKVNCAAVPKDLFESEFFGHVRGAFTGAHKDRAGRFELAHGGTLFLDEIGEIPIDLQAKLLRVLQEGELERLGDDRTRNVDVRVVAATNRNLEADVAAGRFRQDLYYRLSVFPVEVPPLRARREDVVPLAEHFLALYARDLGRGGLRLSDAQRSALAAYDWPGNVRELQHVIERAVILSAEPPLRLDLALPNVQAAARMPTAPAHPPTPPAGTPVQPPARPAPGTLLKDTELRALERDNLVAALERARWRVAGEGGAAELLGLNPSTLRDRMKALGIQRP